MVGISFEADHSVSVRCVIQLDILLMLVVPSVLVGGLSFGTDDSVAVRCVIQIGFLLMPVVQYTLV